MQIRYKGMFEAVELAWVYFATKHPVEDDAGKVVMVDVPRTRVIYRGEIATILGDPAEVEADARGLLEQEANYEPADAAAKALLKQMAKEREERDVPDKPILDAVEGVGRAVA